VSHALERGTAIGRKRVGEEYGFEAESLPGFAIADQGTIRVVESAGMARERVRIEMRELAAVDGADDGVVERAHQSCQRFGRGHDGIRGCVDEDLSPGHQRGSEGAGSTMVELTAWNFMHAKTEGLGAGDRAVAGLRINDENLVRPNALLHERPWKPLEEPLTIPRRDDDCDLGQVYRTGRAHCEILQKSCINSRTLPVAHPRRTRLHTNRQAHPRPRSHSTCFQGAW